MSLSCAIRSSKREGPRDYRVSRGGHPLKAYWCATQPEDPPYTHSHTRLANGSGLYEQMDDAQRDFLDLITNYNIEARYPEDKEELSRTLTDEFCRQMIDETKQLQQWIKDKL